jgi:hypothetical protein
LSNLSTILRRLDAIESKLNIRRDTGNWVRNHSGALIWDDWDMDKPPEADPSPRILEQLQRIRERMQAQPGWKEPSEAEKAAAGRPFEGAIERIRAERQAIRDFTAHVEAELAAGKSLGEITDPVRPSASPLPGSPEPRTHGRPPQAV